MHRDLVFTYGSLCSGSEHPMARWLAERATCLGPATFRGVLLDVGTYPAALASEDPDDVVRGEVHRIEAVDASAVLAELDRYEGCVGEDCVGEGCVSEGGAPALYVRASRTVRLADGSTAEAWIWLWNRETAGLGRIADGDWLRHVAQR